MGIINMLKYRLSVYDLNNKIPVSFDKIMEMVNGAVEHIPDAFNMKSQRVVVLTGDKHTGFWNTVYTEVSRASGGRMSRDRTDSFARAYGTILYFYDKSVVESAQKNYPLYAKNFHDWVMQSNGMLQFAVWVGLRTLGVGANLQHYNPIIDNMTREMFGLNDNWVMVAQMPFGGIVTDAAPKEKQDVSQRIRVEK